MSKRGVAARGAGINLNAGSVKGAPVGPAAEPLRRRPGLFAALLVFFVLWIGVLLALYLRTVYPMRYPATTTAGAKS